MPFDPVLAAFLPSLALPPKEEIKMLLSQLDLDKEDLKSLYKIIHLILKLRRETKRLDKFYLQDVVNSLGRTAKELEKIIYEADKHTLCKAFLKSWAHKKQPCTYKAKKDGLCGRHYKSK